MMTCLYVMCVRGRDLRVVQLQEARAKGAAFTVETCPHYLSFAAEDVKDGDTRFKCAPPLRTASNRDKLWHALKVAASRSEILAAPPFLRAFFLVAFIWYLYFS